MSKYMQIDIRVMPVYEKKFRKKFSRLTDLLETAGYGGLVEKEASFYEMVDYLVTIQSSPNTPDHTKEVLRPFVGALLELKRIAREHLLARRLNELDSVLYRLEDQFEDMETVL